MSVSPDIEPQLDDEVYRQVRMGMLAESAVLLRPRVFAVHGPSGNPAGPDILGWGLEFRGGERTNFAEPGDSAVHLANTAERVLEVLSIIGDVRLTWLDRR